MVIPYRTTKVKSTNKAILGPTTKFNSHQYFRLYSIYQESLEEGTSLIQPLALGSKSVWSKGCSYVVYYCDYSLIEAYVARYGRHYS